MPKKAIKNTPVSSGYVEPVIIENIETVDYHKVKDELFLDENAAARKAKRLKTKVIKDTAMLTVYEVDGERFLDADKAEKKRNLLVKKYREEIRDTVRVYGIDKASQANNLPHMAWLVEHYSLNELKNAKFLWAFNADKENMVRQFFFEQQKALSVDNSKLIDPLNTKYSLEYFFENEPHKRVIDYMSPYRSLTEFSVALNIFRINFDTGFNGFNREWSWLQNSDEINGFKVPSSLNLQFGTQEFRTWVDSNLTLNDKIYKIIDLVNYRVGELLYKTALDMSNIDSNSNIVNIPPFDAVLFNIQKELIVEELLKIIEFIDSNENGLDFHIAVKNNELVYWLYDDKSVLSPFKQF